MQLNLQAIHWIKMNKVVDDWMIWEKIRILERQKWPMRDSCTTNPWCKWIIMASCCWGKSCISLGCENTVFLWNLPNSQLFGSLESNSFLGKIRQQEFPTQKRSGRMEDDLPIQRVLYLGFLYYPNLKFKKKGPPPKPKPRPNQPQKWGLKWLVGLKGQ